MGDLVVDPFLGSGTTGVTCVNLGGRFIGCDIDEKCLEITKGRVLDRWLSINLNE